jgi:hypothetical protein
MTETTRQPRFTQATRRPNFFDGRLLTGADLRGEQDYQRGMRYLQNRTVGWGIVEGLDVTVTATGVSISPGLAIDELGRELVLAEPVDLSADDSLLRACPNPVVTATWAEVPDGLLPSTDDQTGGQAFDAWLERPVISIDPAETVSPPTLVLARVRRRKKRGLVVDVKGRNGFRLRAGAPA